MTLFRKVFQSQARPARDGEAPDPEMLNNVMAAATEETPPLILEPEDSVAAQEMELSAFAEEEHPEAVEAPSKNEAETLTISDSSEEFEYNEIVHEIEEAGDRAGFNDSEPDLTSIMQQVVSAPGSSLAAGETSIAEHQCENAEEAETVAVLYETSEHPGSETQDKNTTQCNPSAEGEGGSDPKGKSAVGVVDLTQQQMPEVEPNPDDPQSCELADLSTHDQAPLDLSGVTALARPVAHESGKASRPTGRVKTRLLGFNRDQEMGGDPLHQIGGGSTNPKKAKFPVGWLVVIDGPGTGHDFSIFTGASTIGRGEDQTITLNFGDNSISRQNHAAIAYDEEVNKFYVGHGGKSNIIRRNARPVLSTEELNHADLLRIGETTLRFVALCGTDFQWNAPEDTHAIGV